MKRLSVFVGIAFLFALTTISFGTIAFADSDKIQNPDNGHWYQRFDNSTMTWHQAKAFCEELGGYLATITSEAEDNFVYENLGETSPNVHPWLGATDENSEGNWEWVTGQPWEYANWAGGEPNDCSGIEHYLVYFTPWDTCCGGGRPSFWNDLGEGANGGCGCGTCEHEWYNMSTICEWWDWLSYDTFENLDPTKWSGGGGDNMWAVYKYIREVPKKKKELLLALEVYGPNDYNGDVWAGNGLRTDPYEVTRSIKAMKVDVEVKEHEPACCGGECAGARVEILGSIFHVSPTNNVCPPSDDPCNPSPTSLNCIPPDAEVHVGIALETQNPNEPDFSEDRLNVRARVYWCETQGSCACGQEIRWDIIGRDIKVGSDNTISWDWDAANDKVIFQINNATPVDFSYHDFLNDVGGSDETLALGAFKDLTLSAGGTNCDGNRITGYMEAAFDNVEVIEY